MTTHRCQRGVRGSHRRFSLLELLVVISLIALLAALLMPSLQKAKQQADAIRCLNSLRQLGQANAAYIDGYGGWCIPAGYGPGYPNFWTVGVLGAAVKNLAGYPGGWPREFLCSQATLAHTNNSIGRSYGLNCGRAIWWGRDPLGWRISQVVSPSKVVLFADGNDMRIGMGHSDYWNYYAAVGEFYSASYNAMTCYRHDERANTVFHDGHAAGMHYATIQMKPEYWYPY